MEIACQWHEGQGNWFALCVCVHLHAIIKLLRNSQLRSVVQEMLAPGFMMRQ